MSGASQWALNRFNAGWTNGKPIDLSARSASSRQGKSESRKVGEVPPNRFGILLTQIETFGFLNCTFLIASIFSDDFPLADFCKGLSSYEGLHQLAQCWSSWKNGWSRSYSGRTCFSAAFLVLFLGWISLNVSKLGLDVEWVSESPQKNMEIVLLKRKDVVVSLCFLKCKSLSLLFLRYACIPFWGSKYVTMRRIFLDFSNVRVMRSYFAQPQTLAEFQVAQENWQHDLFQKVAHQAQKVKLEPWQSLCVT